MGRGLVCAGGDGPGGYGCNQQSRIMKQDKSWMNELTDVLREKTDRRMDVFGNPLPTAYEAKNYPRALAEWLESREPFKEVHQSAAKTCDQCLIGSTKCRYPECSLSCK